MRKNIDISTEDGTFKKISIRAAKSGMLLKAYIEQLVIKDSKKEDE